MSDNPPPQTLGQRAAALWRRLTQLVEPDMSAPAPSTVIIRRRSVIRDGRMRLFFEAVLFGDNPFDLERHGPVRAVEQEPLGELEPWAQRKIAGLRYYVVDPNAYVSVDEAAQAWEPLGVAIGTPPRQV